MEVFFPGPKIVCGFFSRVACGVVLASFRVVWVYTANERKCVC